MRRAKAADTADDLVGRLQRNSLPAMAFLIDVIVALHQHSLELHERISALEAEDDPGRG